MLLLYFEYLNKISYNNNGLHILYLYETYIFFLYIIRITFSQVRLFTVYQHDLDTAQLMVSNVLGNTILINF